MSYFLNAVKYSALGAYVRKRKLNKRFLNDKKIHNAVEKHLGDLPVEKKLEIEKDIRNMAMKYRFTADEYFYYHFMDKSEEERRTFVSDLNRIEVCMKMNSFKNIDKFTDKSKTAKLFSKYYKRDVCGIKGASDLEKLKAFTEKHKKFILKPIDGSFGNGVQILESEWTDAELQQLITKHCTKPKSGFFVEELIVQVPETAQFHPSSLNTLRVATVRFKEGTEVVAAFFRMGRGESIVDNAGAGGVFGTINVETGVIDAVGDEFGNNYYTHPDTGIDMVGFTIPRWQEAVEFAKELSNVLPDNRYTGWDLALTEKGWVMVEGNASGQFVWQIPRQKGFLNETNSILKRLGLRELKKLSV